MRSEQGATLEYYIAPRGSNASGNGSTEQPFGSLDEAAVGIAERHAGPRPSVRPLVGYDQIDIASVAPSGAKSSTQKPRYEFYIDPQSTDADAKGTFDSPWPDLNTALHQVVDREKQGQCKLNPGDRLRLIIREPFSATPIEQGKRRTENVAKSIFFVMTMMCVVPVIAILTFLVVKAWPALTPSFVFENPRNNMTNGGIWAPLIGTFYLVFTSLLVAAPIGVLAGVYLNEYARDNWFNRIVNLAVVNLAGVPSIVHALFGVGAFVTFAHMGESVLAASCTLAIMTLPVIITSTREALASVPKAFREACWNMGASRWQTVRTIVLPNSISGILTGVILQVSRAAGETAPILFTGAAFAVSIPDQGIESIFPYGMFDNCMALSYHLYALLTQVKPPSPQQISSGYSMPLEHIQYGTAVVLIGLVLMVNSLSITLRVYLRSRKKW